MVDRTRGYAHRVDVRAPLELVWRALIEPALIEHWYAPGPRVDARAGGSYWVRIDRDTERLAHIDVFVPPRRLRLIYMPQAHWPDREAVIVDDFMLGPERDFTMVRLLGSGIPQEHGWDQPFATLRGGWERALLRLKLAAEKQVAAAGHQP